MAVLTPVKMLLLSAIMILLLSGQPFLAQDDTNITPHYCSRMGFTIWSNFTLTCSRICNPRAQTAPIYLWYLLLVGKNRSVPISNNPSLINTFETDTGVTLSNSDTTTEEDSCNGEVIEYSLTIENARRSIHGLTVTCGARDDNTTRSLNSTVLYLKSQITTYATFKRTVSPGSSTTISCTRPRFRDREVSIANRWRLQQSGKDTIIIEEEAVSPKVDGFLNETGITLELTSSDTCTYNGFVNYTLTIGNINQKVDGIMITCGAIDRTNTSESTNITDEWYADHSVELVLQASVSTYSQFETSVANGGNFTFNCNRSCGLHIVDLWSLQLEGSDPFIITGKDQQEIFENNNGITLTLRNTENEGCDDNVVEYSLSIWNISEGLILKCGILKNDTQDMWYASHSVKLKIDNSTDLEATVVATMVQLEKCNAEKAAIIGGTVGTILLALLAAVIAVFILFIIVVVQQKKLNKIDTQEPPIISNPQTK